MYRLFLSPHSFSVTIVTLGFRLFFILAQINYTNCAEQHRKREVTWGRQVPSDHTCTPLIIKKIYPRLSPFFILLLFEKKREHIPLDLSSRPFIPLPRFMRPRRAAPLLAPSSYFILGDLPKRHMWGVFHTSCIGFSYSA